MRILYIVPYTPSLIRVRPFQMIRALARRGHEVTVATLWSSERERSLLPDLSSGGVQVVSCHLPRWRPVWNCLRALPSRVPLQAVFSWQPRLVEAIGRTLEQGDYNVIHVEHLRGAMFGLEARQLSASGESRIGARRGIPVIWDSVDCISLLFDQARSHSLSRKWRWMTGFEFPRTRAYESWLVGQFDRVVVTSELDRRALSAACNGALGEISSLPEPLSPVEAATENRVTETQISVVPNGVDLDYFHPGQLPRDGATVTFTGKMSYHANITAVFYLLREVMPRVWKIRPDVRVVVVGKDPPSQIRVFASSPGTGHGVAGRVLVTGTVPDMRPYLWRSTLAVVPLTYGAGIQNKVLEAMACATPVITSARCASGLEAVPGRDLVVADSPSEFAAAILKLLSEPAARESLASAGRAYVESYHDWDRAAAILESIYEDAIRSVSDPTGESQTAGQSAQDPVMEKFS